MQRKIFRSVALERLSSPEQLDQLMQVTTPRGWLALLALIGLIVTVAAWSVSDKIPTEVVGRGILLRGGQVMSVTAPADGRIIRLLAQPGMSVQPGQALARFQPLAGSKLTIVSPYAGRIIDLDVDEQSIVGAGARIAQLEDSDRPLEAVVYMPPENGKNVQVGMAVQVSPSNVRREEYGFIRGRVRAVGALPVTRESMVLVLGNERLADDFLAGGTPIEIRIDLETDPTTPSGLRWSSSRGPASPVGSGSLCAVTVTLAEQPPIRLLLPGDR